MNTFHINPYELSEDEWADCVIAQQYIIHKQNEEYKRLSK